MSTHKKINKRKRSRRKFVSGRARVLGGFSLVPASLAALAGTFLAGSLKSTDGEILTFQYYVALVGTSLAGVAMLFGWLSGRTERAARAQLLEQQAREAKELEQEKAARTAVLLPEPPRTEQTPVVRPARTAREEQPHPAAPAVNTSVDTADGRSYPIVTDVATATTIRAEVLAPGTGRQRVAFTTAAPTEPVPAQV